jgi:hypothetical protein
MECKPRLLALSSSHDFCNICNKTDIFIQYRLNEDYSHLSERLEQHESHQQELQHYIQMVG